MNTWVYLLSLVSVIVYAIFIFAPQLVTQNLYLAGNILMGLVLVLLLMRKKKCPLLLASLIWLVCNYFLVPSHNNLLWIGYDGFAAATVLCNLKT